MIKEKIVVILFFIIVSSVLLDVFLVLNPSIKLFSSTKKMKVVTNDETLKTNNTHSYREHRKSNQLSPGYQDRDDLSSQML